MRVLVFLIAIALGTLANGQNLKLVLPQNVCIASETIPYGIILDADLAVDGEFPLVHIILYTSDGNAVVRYQQRAIGEIGTSLLNLSSDIGGGTYVLCASLLSASMESVIEESCVTLHIIEKDTRELYAFQSQAPDTVNATDISTREEMCIESIVQGTLGFSASVNARMHPSTWHYTNNETVPAQFDFGFRLDPGSIDGFPALMNCDERVLHPIKNTGIVAIPDEEYSRNCQLVDMQSGKVYRTLKFTYPKPTWGKQDLIPFTPKEQAAVILEKIEQRALINRIFQNDLPEIEALRLSDSISAADDEYVLSEFMAFESLELFFKEVVGGARIRTQGDEILFRLLNGDSKNWYNEEPALLIDGRLEEDLSALWDLKFEDCTEVRLYRTLQSIRGVFGPLGRNGIIEVNTRQPVTTGLTVLDGVYPWYDYDLKNVPATPEVAVFRPVQYFAPNRSLQVCFQHADDLGEFVFESVGLDSRTVVRYSVD